MNQRLDQDLLELTDAEDFLEYFQIPYDPQVVNVSRLHILKRFHDYLKQHAPPAHGNASARRVLYKSLLEQAYQDFVHSDPGSEKVFDVFHRKSRHVVLIPADTLMK